MVPPPAMPVAETLTPTAEVPDSKINRDILSVMGRPSLGYFLLLGLAMASVGWAGGLWTWQVYEGLGVGGYTHPVFWGVYIVTFVFWVGIAHAGTLISAILFLFRAKWRNAINRGAEAMTVFAVLTAAQFLGIHVGRMWKSYFILPYPNQRGLWVNFKSPLLWDTFAISTYATISIVFFYVGLIPDLAIARDRATGWRKLVYTALALGWQGTTRQWKSHTRTVLHLSGLATPLVLSVHSVVSWDFASSIVPGWHATIFAPYFVAGAIFSGFAMVLTVMIPVRRIYRLEAYITDYHFENMARFLLLTSMIVSYAYGTEYFIAWYSGVEFEKSAFWLRAFGPYWFSTWVMITCNGIIPQLFWFKRFRTHVPTLFVIATFINIGMWFERYVIIITSLAREYDPAVWGIYTPTWVELSILAGSFGFFAMLFLMFLKIFPVIAIAEVKELAIHEKAHGENNVHGAWAEGSELMPVLLGVFDQPAPVSRATRSIRDRGIATDLEVYSPAAFTEVEDAIDEKPSKVRTWTLVGGLLGVVSGYALTLWMSWDWPIVIGGKPFGSVAPYTVIGFELTILFGGIATLLGLLVVGKLPYGKFGKQDAAYSARFSAEEFGLAVQCDERDVAEIDALLRAHDAKEVSVVEA